jgi:AcrR family transcriptional regulator
VPAPERPLRRDAQRNRELLVAAAREVFGARGLDAPLDEIARRAGVAIGTLYNRFPSREELIEAAFLEPLEQAAEIARRAAEFDDPWEGFVLFLEQTCAMQAVNRGFTEVCTRTFAESSPLESIKAATGGIFADLITRAQESGQLRADFRAEDLAIVLTSTAQSAAVTPKDWRRTLAFLLDGFRAEAAHPLPDA